jgi:hypothetical protein
MRNALLIGLVCLAAGFFLGSAMAGDDGSNRGVERQGGGVKSPTKRDTAPKPQGDSNQQGSQK